MDFTMDFNDKLGYSPEELSKLLPYSVQTLARDRAKKHLQIPFKQTGRKIVYPAHKVREWLDSTDVLPIQYQAKIIKTGDIEVKRSKGRPKGTTKAELAKRRNFFSVT